MFNLTKKVSTKSLYNGRPNTYIFKLKFWIHRESSDIHNLKVWEAGTPVGEEEIQYVPQVLGPGESEVGLHQDRGRLSRQRYYCSQRNRHCQ